MILTDNEMLGGVKAEHDAMLFYARNIEKKILEKIGMPFGWFWYDEDTNEHGMLFTETGERPNVLDADSLIPLYQIVDISNGPA